MSASHIYIADTAAFANAFKQADITIILVSDLPDIKILDTVTYTVKSAAETACYTISCAVQPSYRVKAPAAVPVFSITCIDIAGQHVIAHHITAAIYSPGISVDGLQFIHIMHQHSVVDTFGAAFQIGN